MAKVEGLIHYRFVGAKLMGMLRPVWVDISPVIGMNEIHWERMPILHHKTSKTCATGTMLMLYLSKRCVAVGLGNKKLY